MRASHSLLHSEHTSVVTRSGPADAHSRAVSSSPAGGVYLWISPILRLPAADAPAAQQALDELEQATQRSFADEPSRQVRVALSGGVVALYPQFA